MIPIILCGYTGKTGSILMNYLASQEAVKIVGLINRSSLPLKDTIEQSHSQVVIDFTTPESGYLNGVTALSMNNHYICGTTGMSLEQIGALDQLGKEKGLSVLICANFAKGIQAILKAIPFIEAELPCIWIQESHHISKKDKPSGTSLLLRKTLKNSNLEITSYRSYSPLISHVLTFQSDYETITIQHTVFDKRAFCDGVMSAILKVGSWVGVKHEL